MFDDAPFDDAPRKDDPAAIAARQQLADDTRALMGTAAGRRAMWHVLEIAGVARTSFTGDALTTAFNEGQRNVGLKLLAHLRALAPANTQVMLTEGNFL